MYNKRKGVGAWGIPTTIPRGGLLGALALQVWPLHPLAPAGHLVVVAGSAQGVYRVLEDRGTSQAPVVNLDLAVPCDALCDIWAVVWPPAARGKAWLMMRRHDRFFFRPTVVNPHMGEEVGFMGV